MQTERLALTTKIVRRLPLADRSGQYIVRDTRLSGFYLLVGSTRRTFMVKGDMPRDGKGFLSVKVKVGDADAIEVDEARVIASAYLLAIKRGQHPRPEVIRRHSSVNEIVATAQDADGPTLRQAWITYKTSLTKKGRSPRTIAGYEDHIVRVFKAWTDQPLKSLADNPNKVGRKHDEITAVSGPYAANGAMRTLRAVYNHAWRKNRKALPRDNPVDSVDWNKEHRRNTAMGIKDLPDWFSELAILENPIRREFHLLTLLSASRPGALKHAQVRHLDLARRVLHIPSPKGGEDRAFDIPLSRQMIQSFMRLIRFGQARHPIESRTWLFPADSNAGHIVETKENRESLSKWGNDLRQTYRTIATVARANTVDAKLLMNHAIPGVNEGYITRDKLVEDHLRATQQQISDAIFAAIKDLRLKPCRTRNWLAPRGART